MQPFWVVWSPQSGPPTVTHASPQEARREAERLANNNPGRSFHVLRLEATCSSNRFQWQEAEEYVPF